MGCFPFPTNNQKENEKNMFSVEVMELNPGYRLTSISELSARLTKHNGLFYASLESFKKWLKWAETEQDILEAILFDVGQSKSYPALKRWTVFK